MKIGNLDFGKYPLLLAPMEDVTDESFRLMCKEFGADMVYTEFVSSDALVRNINSTMRKLSIQDAPYRFTDVLSMRWSMRLVVARRLIPTYWI